MAEYRITYNPYKSNVKIEKGYGGNPPKWDIIGEKSNDLEWKRFIGDKKSLAHIAGGLLSKIEKEEINKNCHEIKLKFAGLERHYNLFCLKLKKYKSEHENSIYSDIEYINSFQEPKIISDQLEEYFNDIKNKFSSPEYSAINNEIESIKNMELNQNFTTILVAGEQNVGKSTFINALIGKEIMPTSSKVETANVCIIRNGIDNRIELKNKDKKIAFIDCDNNTFEIYEDSELIRELLNKIKNSKGVANSDNIQAQWIYQLNQECRKIQKSKNTLPFKEMNVFIKDLKIGYKGYNYAIKDVPGSGADGEFYGDEHNEIIRQTAKDTLNSIIIYIFDNRSFSRSAAREALDNIINESGDSQIDVENSIYIINACESVDKQARTEILEIKQEDKKFRDKSLAFTDSKAALQIKTNTIDDDDLQKWQSGKKHMLYLDCSIPQKAEMEKTMDNLRKESSIDNVDYLINTGIPCVEYLLDDYAENQADIHSIESYNTILDKILLKLEELINNQQENLEGERNSLDNERKKIRADLIDKCDRSYAWWTDSIDEKKITNAFQRSIAVPYNNDVEEMYNSIKDFRQAIEDKNERDIKTTKIYKKNALTKEQKEMYKKVIVELKQEKRNTEKINQTIVDELKDKVNSKKRKLTIDIKDFQKNFIQKNIDNLKDDLKETIERSEDLPEEVIEALKKHLDNIKISEIDDFDADKNNFKFNAITKRTMNKKIEDEFKNEFETYWNDEIATPCVKKVLRDIMNNAKQITDNVKEQIDEISMPLIEKQKEIDSKQSSLDNLKEKQKEVKDIVDKKDNILHERG